MPVISRQSRLEDFCEGVDKTWVGRGLGFGIGHGLPHGLLFGLPVVNFF